MFAGGTVNYAQGVLEYYNGSLETTGYPDPVAIAITNNVLQRLSSPRTTDVGLPGATSAIRVVRHDIYDLDDPATSARVYRWVDAAHALTRERFIRSLLLFEVGDLLDPLRLAESELILRGTGFLNPVTISAHPAAGGAEVVVETRDQWTNNIDVSYNATGNRKESGGSISDDNLLGTGKSVSFGMTSDPERTSTTIGYKDLAFLGRLWQIDLEDTEDPLAPGRGIHQGSADEPSFD